MLKRLTALCLATLCCAGAAAQDWYAGAAIGFTSVESDTGAGDFSGDAIGYKLFAGIRTKGRLSYEFAYADLGAPDDTVGGFNVEYDAIAFTGHVVYTRPASESLSFFAKGGLIYWQSDLSSSGNSMSFSGEDDRTNVTVGLGALFKTAGRFDYRVEAEWHDIDNLDQAIAVSVGAVYSFGGDE